MECYGVKEDELKKEKKRLKYDIFFTSFRFDAIKILYVQNICY